MLNQATTANGPAGGQSLFRKDFTLVVLGQIISLFGNAVLRFALPLYILNESGSPALFGVVSACSFLPMIVLSPVGGIIADRVNKQRIMVVLDFLTAGLILAFILLSGSVSVTPLVVVMLMLLYGIQVAYSPAVQASLPQLVQPEQLVPANAVVNLVQSFSALSGPVIGGVLYAAYGLGPILSVSCGCFAFSAIMELFIRIPHRRQKAAAGVWALVRDDMTLSFRFIIREKPVMFKAILLVFCFNLFLSSVIIIGLPVLVTQTLGMSSKLYGVAQGATAAGGLVGGLLAGVLGKRLDVRRCHVLLLLCALGLIPMGLVLLLGANAMVSYVVITAACFLMMICATMFSVQMLAFAQAETPVEIVGKVISCIMALSVSAQPVGQALYGMLFERFAGWPWAIILFAAVASCVIALFSKKTFGQL